MWIWNRSLLPVLTCSNQYNRAHRRSAGHESWTRRRGQWEWRKEISCPPYPIYRIRLPPELSEHRRRIQQHNWKWGKNTTISNLSTHKKSYFHTGNGKISHKHVHLDIFHINRNDFLEWIFMSAAPCTVGATFFFLLLVTQFGDWWIAVRLLSTVHSLPGFGSISHTAKCSSYTYDRGTDLFSSPSVRICVLLRHILINTSLFCGWKLELQYCILLELNMQWY